MESQRSRRLTRFLADVARTRRADDVRWRQMETSLRALGNVWPAVAFDEADLDALAALAAAAALASPATPATLPGPATPADPANPNTTASEAQATRRRLTDRVHPAVGPALTLLP